MSVIDWRAVLRRLMVGGTSLVLLGSCASTPPAKPPIAEPPSRPTSEQPVANPSPPAGPPGSDYPTGYPQLAPAPKARADGSLQSFTVLNTGPYLANGNTHNLTWTNDSGRLLAIYKVYLWTGVDRGGIGDVHIDARRASDNSYIGILQWDHYAEPTVPQHGQQFDYPVPMLLDPGDSITILHFANGFAPGWHAHHVLILWVK